VLQALSDVKHPDLAVQLRLAAAAFAGGHHHDLPRWLQGGLFKHALRILQTLPTLRLSCNEATDTCAAAAAVLYNIIKVARHHGIALPGSTTADSLAAQLLSKDVLSAVVQCGMLSAAARTPLPPGREICMEHAADFLPQISAAIRRTVSHTKHFWTPMRVCSYLVAEALLDCTINYQVRTANAAEINAVLVRLLRTDVFRHLLQTALEEPSSALLLACGHACVRVLCTLVAAEVVAS
jgi:hypothetical protein